MSAVFPRLYAILDAALLWIPAEECARMVAEAGVTLLQYRDKQMTPRRLLPLCRELSQILGPAGARFVVNDRADVAVLAGAGGVHVGQEDLPVEQARAVCGRELWVGVSTHNLEQVRRAAATSADYVAVGPIFATSTKAQPDPVVGTEFIREARRLTTKPLVAIGGITLERAEAVFAAGADSVAVARDLLTAADPAARAAAYLDLARRMAS